jgi:adenylate cyclase
MLGEYQLAPRVLEAYESAGHEARRMTYSRAVEAAWKMAAGLAKRRQDQIRPEDILYSIVSSGKHLQELTAADGDQRSEFETVACAFEEQALALFTIERLLENRGGVLTANNAAPATSAVGPIGRSDSCKRAFEWATRKAAEETLEQVCLRHLVAGILCCCPEVNTALGIDAALSKALTNSLAPVARATAGFPQPASSPYADLQQSRDIVLSSLDASVVLKPELEWKEIGPKLAALCEVAWETGASGNLAALLQAATKRILASIPRATHSAILLLDSCSGDLLLKAHTPAGSVSVSKSSAQQALDRKQAFIWQKEQDLSQSQVESSLESGIYAPILADEKMFGVLCVNSNNSGARLTGEDLFLAASLGHQIGLVLANRSLKAEVAEKITVLERLMTNFSPQVRTHLIQRAQAGRLTLGGVRSNVSILCSDIRGFTVMAAGMDTDDLISLLNDYFAAMVEAIFRNEGTVDKFIGDALLAVFGSPEQHPRHTEQAARAALAMQMAIAGVTERRRAHGQKTCEIGIGVHTGEVIHGFIGSVERMEYTIIGDAVNMTARYCSGAGRSEIIISPQVYEKLWGDLNVTPVEVPTKHEGTLSAYRLLKMRSR